jgi:integrase/recombinase XerD
MIKTTPDLGRHVQAFFADHLIAQRDLSPHTVLSYRDAMKLFLWFAAQRRKKPVADLGFDDVGPEIVLAFLDDLEKRRRCSARTRNVRLAALHTFFRWVAGREPQVLEICQRVSAIPVKKTPIRMKVFLEHDEVLHVLARIDQSAPLGRRDYLLVHLLFATGLRASEVAGLRTSAFRLERPYQVRVMGKGRKERVCPLRSSTVLLLRRHMHERGLDQTRDVPLFVGRREEPLTRYGVLRLVQRHVRVAAADLAPLAAKRVGPHTFRHSTAVHLLRSGNDLETIRSWLGHVSIETTDQYTETDHETKRRALEVCQPLPAPRRRPSWKRDRDLLAWLEAL